MNSKAIKILKLFAKNNVQTSKALACEMNISVRSVGNYIKEINTLYPGLITSNQKGYYANLKAISVALYNEKNNSIIPQNSKERVLYIINALLKNTDFDTFDIDDFADELYVSSSTIRSELNRIKAKLHQFDLELLVNGNNIKVHGSESNKRKLLSKIIYENSNVNYISLDYLQEIFPNLDIVSISNLVRDSLRNHNCLMNDYSIINLVLHIAITIDRICANIRPDLFLIEKTSLEDLDMSLASEIASKLEDKFSITFSSSDIYELALLTFSRSTSIDYASLNINSLKELLGNQVYNLVLKLINVIKHDYYIELSDSKFFIRFSLHIQNLIFRAKNNYYCKNPLAHTIKASNPLIYEMAISLAAIIQEDQKILINADEIAYIAFHIGSALDQQKNLNNKIKAILFCPDYYDIKESLMNQINQYFNEDLVLIDVFCDESQITTQNDAELIISTLQLRNPTKIPLVLINMFFGKTDKEHISKQLDIIAHEKQKNSFSNNIRKLLDPNLFIMRNGLKTSENCIDYMAQTLINNGYCDETFIQEVYERENVASTLFDNFAIPHPLHMNGYKTGIAILISSDSIKWDSQKINLVIMLCFNKNERYLFNEIFESLTMILSNHQNIHVLSLCSSYDQFIDTLISLY
jgi:lichenan operon transcriptional antiterminator